MDAELSSLSITKTLETLDHLLDDDDSDIFSKVESFKNLVKQKRKAKEISEKSKSDVSDNSFSENSKQMIENGILLNDSDRKKISLRLKSTSALKQPAKEVDDLEQQEHNQYARDNESSKFNYSRSSICVELIFMYQITAKSSRDESRSLSSRKSRRSEERSSRRSEERRSRRSQDRGSKRTRDKRSRRSDEMRSRQSVERKSHRSDEKRSKRSEDKRSKRSEERRLRRDDRLEDFWSIIITLYSLININLFNIDTIGHHPIIIMTRIIHHIEIVHYHRYPGVHGHHPIHHRQIHQNSMSIEENLDNITIKLIPCIKAPQDSIRAITMVLTVMESHRFIYFIKWKAHILICHRMCQVS